MPSRQEMRSRLEGAFPDLKALGIEGVSITHMLSVPPDWFQTLMAMREYKEEAHFEDEERVHGFVHHVYKASSRNNIVTAHIETHPSKANEARFNLWLVPAAGRKPSKAHTGDPLRFIELLKGTLPGEPSTRCDATATLLFPVEGERTGFPVPIKMPTAIGQFNAITGMRFSVVGPRGKTVRESVVVDWLGKHVRLYVSLRPKVPFGPNLFGEVWRELSRVIDLFRPQVAVGQSGR